jgi:hypothetical protein
MSLHPRQPSLTPEQNVTSTRIESRGFCSNFTAIGPDLDAVQHGDMGPECNMGHPPGCEVGLDGECDGRGIGAGVSRKGVLEQGRPVVDLWRALARSRTPHFASLFPARYRRLLAFGGRRRRWDRRRCSRGPIRQAAMGQGRPLMAWRRWRRCASDGRTTAGAGGDGPGALRAARPHLQDRGPPPPQLRSGSSASGWESGRWPTAVPQSAPGDSGSAAAAAPQRGQGVRVRDGPLPRRPGTGDREASTPWARPLRRSAVAPFCRKCGGRAAVGLRRGRAPRWRAQAEGRGARRNGGYLRGVVHGAAACRQAHRRAVWARGGEDRRSAVALMDPPPVRVKGRRVRIRSLVRW